MFKSIQWKIVFIFFLLTLMAMEFMGISLTTNLKNYYLSTFDNMMTTQAGLLSWSVEPYLQSNSNVETEEVVKNFAGQIEGIKNISVLDAKGNLLVSTDGNVINQTILTTEIISALDGTMSSSTYIHPTTGETIKRLAYPVINQGKQRGVIYMEASLKETYGILNRIKKIIQNTIVAAILITIMLAFFMARTITKPIRQVTAKTAQLATGDYDQPIVVKSDDEIGQLAHTFNYLSQKLKSTMSEITNEKTKMEAIFNYMTDGVLAFNLSGEMILYNDAAKSMLDLTDSQFINIREPRSILQPELKKAILNTLNQKENLQHEEFLIGTENKQYLRANFAPFRNEEEQIGGIVIVLNDVTEQEKLQNMQHEFVANVSHELRTPLTVIRSYTETLQEGAVENTALADKFLGVIHSEAVRMTNLVKDLLELSQFEYQETKWKKSIIELNSIMPLLRDKMIVNTNMKNQTLNVETTVEPLCIFADKERIEQVILNIVSNAIKYTQESGTITVSTQKDQHEAVILIKDNGMGIPKEDLPRLFERFYRVDKARSRELGGTGLGLSIARQIIEAHKGTITIYSEGLGQGTCVTIRLPIERS